MKQIAKAAMLGSILLMLSCSSFDSQRVTGHSGFESAATDIERKLVAYMLDDDQDFKQAFGEVPDLSTIAFYRPTVPKGACFAIQQIVMDCRDSQGQYDTVMYERMIRYAIEDCVLYPEDKQLLFDSVVSQHPSARYVVVISQPDQVIVAAEVYRIDNPLPRSTVVAHGLSCDDGETHMRVFARRIENFVE